MRCQLSNLRLLLPILLLVISCGGDSGTTVEPDPTPDTITIALSASAAAPLDEIDISGIPSGREAYIVVSTEGSDVETIALLSERQAVRAGASSSGSAGSYYIITPVHTVDPVNGGQLKLRVEGNNLTSNTVTLDVGPLPLATTTVQDLVTDLQAMFDVWLLVHGTSRDELRAAQNDPLSLPARLLPLLVAYHALDNPDNPNNLRAAVDGPIPDFNNEIIDWDLENRVLTAAGAEAAFASELASFDSLAADTTIVPNPSQFGGVTSRNAASVVACIDSGDFGIYSAGALDAAMRGARFGIDRLDGASGKALKVMSVALSAATAYEFDGPAAIPQKGLKLFSTGIWIMKQMSSAAGGLLPSYFDNGQTTFDLTITDFNEDDPTAGEWLNFYVLARSAGWVADKAIMETILKTAGKELVGKVVEKLQGVTQSVVKFLMTQEMKLIYARDAGVIEFCPHAWGITFLTSDAEYAKASFTGTSIYLAGNPEYYAEEVGISQFRVETAPGSFGRQAAVASRQAIEVHRIGIVIDPSLVYRKVNESTTFTAMLDHANDLRVNWTYDPRLKLVGGDVNGPFVQLKTPSTAWTGPLEITARSMSNTGAREGKISSDPREALAAILPLNANIIITPAGICIPLGTTQAFDAVVTGVTDQSVTWSASAGFFAGSAGNVYNAPGTAVGDVTITATSVENPSLTGSVTVEVSDCSCYWSLGVTGDVTGVWEGDFVLWRDDIVSLIWGDDGDGGFPGFAFGPDGQIGAGGDYPVIGSIGFGPADVFASSEDAEAGFTLPTMTILSIDSETLTGIITGRLCKPIAVEPYCAIIDFTLEFRSKHQFRGPGCNSE